MKVNFKIPMNKTVNNFANWFVDIIREGEKGEFLYMDESNSVMVSVNDPSHSIPDRFFTAKDTVIPEHLYKEV